MTIGKWLLIGILWWQLSDGSKWLLGWNLWPRFKSNRSKKGIRIWLREINKWLIDLALQLKLW